MEALLQSHFGCLASAACVGFLTAWFFRQAFHEKELAQIEKKRKEQFLSLQSHAVNLAQALSAKEAELHMMGDQRDHLERLSLQLESKNSTISDLKERLSLSETEPSDPAHAKKIANYESEILRLRTRNAELESQFNAASKGNVVFTRNKKAPRVIRKARQKPTLNQSAKKKTVLKKGVSAPRVAK